MKWHEEVDQDQENREVNPDPLPIKDATANALMVIDARELQLPEKAIVSSISQPNILNTIAIILEEDQLPPDITLNVVLERFK